MPSERAMNNLVLKRALRALLAPGLALPGLALAGPTGEDVIRGNADVIRPDGNRTIIDQHTQRAVINWQTFNVDADEYVIFNQPGASSVVLNRVLGGDASYILGHMQANGQVFLLNAQGVYFTHGATLDVQGFLGSTLDMNPDSFMNGDYTLTRSVAAPMNAAVSNDGTLSAGPGGYVVLAGDYTENTGIITATAGTVALVAGSALTLDIEGDGLVNFAVNEAALGNAAGVRNAGSLIADGGRVIMTAKVANDLVATAVNNEGLVRARSIEERDGEIHLVGFGGDVVNAGTLDADGVNADGGGIGIYSDRDVVLRDGAVQTAAGDANHDGGVIRAIAEGHLDYQRDNVLRVTGGRSGGFVEVSGHGSLALRGIPQIGAGGTFLIDPNHIEINDTGGVVGGTPSASTTTFLGADYIKANLEAGQDVILVANSTITYSGAGTSITVGGGTADLSMIIGSIGAGGTGCSYGVCIDSAPVITPTSGGTIDLTGLDITINGNIKLEASNGTISFDRLATTNGNIDIKTDFGGIGGTINGGAGGIAATGYVDIYAGLSGDVTLNGAVNADGNLTITGRQVTTHSLRGHIVNVNANSFGAAMTINGNVNADSRVNFSGSGDITIAGNVQAARIDLSGQGNITTGNLRAHGSLGTSDGEIFISAGSGGHVATGALTAINDNGDARIDVRATNGGVTINGDITASGGTASYGGNGTSIYVEANGNTGVAVNGDIMATGVGGSANVVEIRSGSGINITGGVTLTANPGEYSDGPDNNGVTGHAEFVANAGSFGDLDIGGPIKVTGTGVARVGLYGRNVTTGNIEATANPESFRNTTVSGGGATARIETVTAGGIAEIDIAAAGSNGVIDVGNIIAKGPDARVMLHDAISITTGAITLNATGNDIETSYTADYGGTTTGRETIHGGFAELLVGGATSYGGGANVDTSVNVGGAITVSARGRAGVTLLGDTIATRGINATATAGTYTREGEPSPLLIDGCDGECQSPDLRDFSDWPYNTHGDGPTIDTGTFTGGLAEVTIAGGMDSYGTTGAATVNVNGGITIGAPGNARLHVRGNDITVSGATRIDAGHATQDGTFDRMYSDSTGTSWQETGTVRSSFGQAEFDIAGDGNVRLGSISASGPGAGGQIEGANVRVGAVTVEASGGELDVVETRTSGNTSEQFEFHGTNLLTGLGLNATNALEVTGDLTVNAVGAGGAILEGASIATRNITINVADADYTVTAAQLGGERSFTAGNAILGFEGATAAVNGSVAINADGAAHFGGNANVSGDFTIDAGRGVTRTIPDTVQFLNGLDSDDDDATIPLPGAFNVRAANIRIASDAGPLQLNGATLRATGALDLATGGNMSVSNVTFSGATVQMTAGGNITNSSPAGTITAGALAIIAGGNVNLANTALIVGNGRIDGIAGDTRFLELLGREGIAIPGGGPNLYIEGQNVALGTLALSGDYVMLHANALSIAGNVSSSNPDLLLQIAPLGAGATFSLEGSSPSGGDARYLYDTLAAFNAGTLALGTTNHTGGAGVSANSASLDIGDTNLFVLTSGAVRGLDRVVSTGVVKDLATLLASGFDVPQTDEIDTRHDVAQALRDEYALHRGGNDDEEEGDEEGEDTDTDTSVEENDDGLIRQDTVDEELMCR